MTAWNRIKGHRITGLGLAFAAAACSSNTTNQGWDETQRDLRSDEVYESLIHRLELGAEALEDLGRDEALEQVLLATDAVRAERAAALAARGGDASSAARERDQAESDEIREVRRRLAVMRHAVDAYVEIGDMAAAEEVERAMHTRELAIEGRREEAAALRERGPNRGELSALLARAARLHADWSHPDRAGQLVELSGVYRDQSQRDQVAQAQDRAARECQHVEEHRSDTAHEGFSSQALADRDARITVLRWAHAAQAEAGNEKNAEHIVQMLHVGRLQQKNADDDRIAQASEGLSMDLAVEILLSSADLYQGWGFGGRADSCANLAELYAHRTRAERESAQPREASTRGEVARPREASEPRSPAGAEGEFGAALDRISHRLDSLERNLKELELMQKKRQQRR